MAMLGLSALPRAIISAACVLAIGCFGPNADSVWGESDTISRVANRAGLEQVFEQVPPISRIIWSPDAKSLILVATDGSLRIIKPPKYKNAKRLTRPIKSLGTVHWSPDSRWLVVEGERPSDTRRDSPGARCGWSTRKANLRQETCYRPERYSGRREGAGFKMQDG